MAPGRKTLAGQLLRSVKAGMHVGQTVSPVSALGTMLHCNMTLSTSLQLRLDDVLAELVHARRQGDLGRLALVAYCEARRWARDAGKTALAEMASEMITRSPHSSREAFLRQIDALIEELQSLQVPSRPASLPVGDPRSGFAPART